MSHDPIKPEQLKMMNELASMLDEILNGDERPKKLGFALLVYNFGEDLSGTGRINYVGNGERKSVLVALKELVARWEGRYSDTSRKH